MKQHSLPDQIAADTYLAGNADQRGLVRGTFSAFEAATALGAGGVQDRIAQATAETARNTQRIAELAARLPNTRFGSFVKCCWQ